MKRHVRARDLRFLPGGRTPRIMQCASASETRNIADASLERPHTYFVCTNRSSRLIPCVSCRIWSALPTSSSLPIPRRSWKVRSSAFQCIAITFSIPVMLRLSSYRPARKRQGVANTLESCVSSPVSMALKPFSTALTTSLVVRPFFLSALKRYVQRIVPNRVLFGGLLTTPCRR